MQVVSMPVVSLLFVPMRSGAANAANALKSPR